MQNANIQNSLDLIKVIRFLKDHAGSLIVWSICGLVCSLIFSFFFVTPQYSSRVDLLVNQKTDDMQAQYTAQQADIQAINTYKDIIKKDIILTPVLKLVRKNDNYQGNYGSLNSSVDISTQTNSQVMTINITESNPYLAADIGNYIADVFTKKIKKMMKVNNVTVVSKAKPNPKAVSPNKTLYSLIGVTIGFVIGLTVSVVRDLLDRTIKESSYLTDNIGLVNLGSVYHIEADSSNLKAISVVRNDSEKSQSVGRRRV